MADTSPSADLLDRAGALFIQAEELGSLFRPLTGPQPDGHPAAPAAWWHIRRPFELFRDATLDLLRDARPHLPDGPNTVLTALLTAADITRRIETAMQTPAGTTGVPDVAPADELAAVASAGQGAVARSRNGQRPGDQYSGIVSASLFAQLLDAERERKLQDASAEAERADCARRRAEYRAEWQGIWARLLAAFDTAGEYRLRDAEAAGAALADAGAPMARFWPVVWTTPDSAAVRLQRLTDWNRWQRPGPREAAALLLDAARGMPAARLAIILRQADEEPNLRAAFGWLEFMRDGLFPDGTNRGADPVSCESVEDMRLAAQMLHGYGLPCPPPGAPDTGSRTTQPTVPHQTEEPICIPPEVDAIFRDAEADNSRRLAYEHRCSEYSDERQRVNAVLHSAAHYTATPPIPFATGWADALVEMARTLERLDMGDLYDVGEEGTHAERMARATIQSALRGRAAAMATVGRIVANERHRDAVRTALHEIAGQAMQRLNQRRLAELREVYPDLCPPEGDPRDLCYPSVPLNELLPARPEPDESLVNAAMRDVAVVIQESRFGGPNAHLSATPCECYLDHAAWLACAEGRHPRAAADWAVYRHVQAGRLCVVAPTMYQLMSSAARAQHAEQLAKRYRGGREATVSDWDFFEMGRILQLRSTPALWVWWRSEQSTGGAGSDGADQSYTRTPLAPIRDDPEQEAEATETEPHTKGIDVAPPWADLGEAKQEILRILSRSSDPLIGKKIASDTGYKYGSLRHHFPDLQRYGYIDKSKDGYTITSAGKALLRCE